jgi:hypothetical protein
VDVVRIHDDLLRFSSYAEPIDLSFTREALLALPVALVAPGHGPCIRL